MLVTISDYKHFETKIREDTNTNTLYEMGIDILNKGINASTYKKRLEILEPIFGSQEINFFQNYIQIDCQTNVGFLANIIFKNTPSFEELSECNLGCPARYKKLPVAQIDRNLLLQNDFYNVIQNHIILTGPKKCCQKECSGYETTMLRKLGSIIIFDICTYDSIRKPLKLQDLTRTIANPINTNRDLQLVGLVNYKVPLRTRSSTEALGHYTAIALRTGNCWIEYNDLISTEKQIKKSLEINPHLLVYIQN